MKENGHSLQGYVLVFLAGLLWGTIGIFVKEMSLRGADALLISFLRVLFAFMVMLLLTVIRCGIQALKIAKKELFFCALLGIVCQGIYNIFYSYAVTLAGVSISAVLLNIAPVITLMTSALLFSEKINVWKLIAIFLNVMGCVLTVTGGHFSIQSFSVIGIGCGIGAGISYAMTAILGRIATANTNVWVSSTYSYLFAALLLLIPGRAWSMTSNSCFLQIIVIGLFLAIIPTALAYVLYYKGLSQITETSKVPVVASGETIVAALLGVFLYQEELNVISVFGILLVLISIVFMNLKKGYGH